VQYVLACALSEGLVSLDHFSDTAVQEPAIRQVMSRIQAVPDPDATMDTTEHFYARVRVTMSSGEQVECFVDRPLGRDRDHPLPAGTLQAKFRDCVTQVLTDEAAGTLADLLLRLDKVGPIAGVSEVIAKGLRPPTEAHPAARAS
jgi:2-methylcitrate dehydratase PrpD